jgi:hypothetical protein
VCSAIRRARSASRNTPGSRPRARNPPRRDRAETRLAGGWGGAIAGSSLGGKSVGRASSATGTAEAVLLRGERPRGAAPSTGALRERDLRAAMGVFASGVTCDGFVRAPSSSMFAPISQADHAAPQAARIRNAAGLKSLSGSIVNPFRKGQRTHPLVAPDAMPIHSSLL